MPDGAVKHVHAVASRGERWRPAGRVYWGRDGCYGLRRDGTEIATPRGLLARQALRQRQLGLGCAAAGVRVSCLGKRTTVGTRSGRDAVPQQALWESCFHREDRDRVSKWCAQGLRRENGLRRRPIASFFRTVRQKRCAFRGTIPLHGRTHGGEVAEWGGDSRRCHRGDDLAKEALQNVCGTIKESPGCAFDGHGPRSGRGSGAPDADGGAGLLNHQASTVRLRLAQARHGWPRDFSPDDKKDMWQKGRRSTAIRRARRALKARARRLRCDYRGSVRASRLRDEAGNIVKWYGRSTDIETAPDQSPSESEQRFRGLVRNRFRNGLWESGPDHLVTKRVGSTLMLSGIAPSSLTGDGSLRRLRPMSNRSPKNGDASGPMRRTHWPCERFRLQHQIRDRPSGICPASASHSLRPRHFSRLSGHRHRYYGNACRADTPKGIARGAGGTRTHVTRRTTLGELTARSPMKGTSARRGVVANAEDCLRARQRKVLTWQPAAARQHGSSTPGNRAPRAWSVGQRPGDRQQERYCSSCRLSTSTSDVGSGRYFPWYSASG